jgi:hypothetical protein
MKILGFHVPLTAAATPVAATSSASGSSASAKSGIVGSGLSTLSSAAHSVTAATSTVFSKVSSFITYIPRKIYSAIAWVLGKIFTPIKYLFVKTEKQQQQADQKAIEKGKFTADQARAKLAKLPAADLKAIYTAVGVNQRGYIMTALQAVNPFAAGRESLGAQFVASNDAAAIAAYKGHLDAVLA